MVAVDNIIMLQIVIIVLISPNFAYIQYYMITGTNIGTIVERACKVHTFVSVKCKREPTTYYLYVFVLFFIELRFHPTNKNKKKLTKAFANSFNCFPSWYISIGSIFFISNKDVRSPMVMLASFSPNNLTPAFVKPFPTINVWFVLPFISVVLPIILVISDPKKKSQIWFLNFYIWSRFPRVELR